MPLFQKLCSCGKAMSSQENMPTLYYDDISPPVRFVLMTLKALNLQAEMEKIHLHKLENRSEDYMKINPLHRVPTMTCNDGRLIITDSHAICAYLVDKYRKGSTLFPEDVETRARINSMMYFNNGILFPRESAIMNSPFNPQSQNPQAFSSAMAAYIESLGYLESFCQKGKWLCGKNMTLADLCCISTFASAELLVPIEAGKFPAVEKWAKLCKSDAAFVEGYLPGLENLKNMLKSYGNFEYMEKTQQAYAYNMINKND